MSLLEPWYLLGLLGLFLPWLLHRFSHHEPPEQAFPTTRFLEPTKPPATSKRKLRYWLLLALRLLFLGILCLLFAQPWLNSLNNASESERVQLVVLDTSFSMRAEGQWQQAQDKLDAVLSALPDKDAVQLFSYSGQLTELTDITNDRGLLNTAASRVDPGYESADYGELMRRLDRVASDINKPVSATFVTDAQRSNLPVQMNTLLASRISQFRIEPVIAEISVNYHLAAVAVTSDTVTARVSVNVAASEPDSADHNNTGPVQKRIEVSMKDRVLATRNVTLSPGENKTLQFDSLNLPADTAAFMQVSFAETDELPDDDQVTIPVRGLSTMEVVLTSIGGEVDAQAQVFVSTALETDGNAKVANRDASAALSPSVRHVLAFVDDPASIPDAINRFVADGGNALVLPRLASTSGQGNVSANAIGVSSIDLPHTLALGDIDWFDARFYSVPELKLQDNDRVLLGLDTGVPLLVERSVGDLGRLLILNDALDGFNSDLPLQPAFVQLMQHVMSYFNASNALPVELTVGRDLFLPANTQILNPAGDAMLELSQLGGVNHVRIVEPGVYNVLGSSSNDNVTVVLDPIESNLSGISRTELDAWQARHDTNTGNSDTESEPSENVLQNAISRELKDTHSIWRWLLPVLLVFLIVESLLANRMLWVRREGW